MKSKAIPQSKVVKLVLEASVRELAGFLKHAILDEQHDLEGVGFTTPETILLAVDKIEAEGHKTKVHLAREMALFSVKSKLILNAVKSGIGELADEITNSYEFKTFCKQQGMDPDAVRANWLQAFKKAE